MSSELRKKLSAFEVTPPAGVWNAIALNLDEQSAGAQLAGKLSGYETQPPADTWNKISAALDNELQPAFAERLASYELAPPAGNWQKIANALAEAENIPVIPLHYKKTSSFWKYAAAAAVIGLIAFSIVWINNSNTTQAVAINNKPSTNTTNNNLPSLQTNAAGAFKSFTQGQSDENKIEHLIAKADYGDIRKKMKYSNAGFDEPENTPVQLANTFSINNFKERVQLIEYADNDISYDPSKVADANPYMMFIGADGSPVRLSKKLSDMVDCINNGNTLGNQDCKERVKQWREKIAKSPITASPNNIFDLVDLIKTLQDNQP